MSGFLRWRALPNLWLWLLITLCLTAAWAIFMVISPPPPELAPEIWDMSTRFKWWLAPPLVVVAFAFYTHWVYGSSKMYYAELGAKAQQQADEAAAVAAKAHQQFALEIRGLGVTVDKYRQANLLKRIDQQVSTPYQSIMSQNPEDYTWSVLTRSQQDDIREGNAFEAALTNFVERWPIPVVVAGPNTVGYSAAEILTARQKAGLGISLFTVLDETKGEISSQSPAKLFESFDQNPDLPAALLFSWDAQGFNAGIRVYDGNFVPKLFSAFSAIVVSRTDRVDTTFRKYAHNDPYKLNKFDTVYDVIKLWNAYWAADTDYDNTPNNHEVMPVDFWKPYAEKLSGSLKHYEDDWFHRIEGFKPTLFAPVRWTKWQVKEYDDSPMLGYLHRPVTVSFVDEHGKMLGERAQYQAFLDGWMQALETLPEGVAPTRLFFDRGHNPHQMAPLAYAMAHDNTPHAIPMTPPTSFDMEMRIGDTGISATNVMISLGVMRSYFDGGASAIVNLRDGKHATIIMVSPPSDEQKQHNTKIYGKDPFAAKIAAQYASGY